MLTFPPRYESWPDASSDVSWKAERPNTRTMDGSTICLPPIIFSKVVLPAVGGNKVKNNLTPLGIAGRGDAGPFHPIFIQSRPIRASMWWPTALK